MSELSRTKAFCLLAMGLLFPPYLFADPSPIGAPASQSTPGDGARSAPETKTSAGTIELAPIVVTGNEPDDSDLSRHQIDLSGGMVIYSLNQSQINTISQGADSKFNQILVRTPGVSDDTYGAVHFREEDPYYRYYINGTLLPGGINGFGQDIDTHFVDTITTRVGALSAYYPEGNYGIIDIRTKSGAALNGGSFSMYGGSFDTLHPNVSYGTSSGGTDFYFNGSYLHNNLGLENTTSDSNAIHDETNQYKGFLYASHQFKDSGRLTLMLSASDADFQIPNTPGQISTIDFSNPAVTNAPTRVNSTALDERQNEQTYYGLIAYQQTIDDLSFQISQVNRDSTVKFTPDVNGDLYYNGAAAGINDYLLTNGLQGDFTYTVDESHTVRTGFFAETSGAGGRDVTTVFPANDEGTPTGPSETFRDNHFIRAYDYALYLQDEWKATSPADHQLWTSLRAGKSLYQ